MGKTAYAVLAGCARSSRPARGPAAPSGDHPGGREPPLTCKRVGTGLRNAPHRRRNRVGRHTGGHALGPSVVRGRSRWRPCHRRRAGSTARIRVRRRRLPSPVRHPQLHPPAGGRTVYRSGGGARSSGGGQGGLRPGGPGSFGRGRWLARLGGRHRGHGRGRDAHRSAGGRGPPASPGRDGAGVGAARRRGLQADPQLPFFVRWRSDAAIHPSVGGGATGSRSRSRVSTGSTTGSADAPPMPSPTSPSSGWPREASRA